MDEAMGEVIRMIDEHTESKPIDYDFAEKLAAVWVSLFTDLDFDRCYQITKNMQLNDFWYALAGSLKRELGKGGQSVQETVFNCEDSECPRSLPIEISNARARVKAIRIEALRMINERNIRR
jgi:hypothetical protein